MITIQEEAPLYSYENYIAIHYQRIFNVEENFSRDLLEFTTVEKLIKCNYTNCSYNLTYLYSCINYSACDCSFGGLAVHSN